MSPASRSHRAAVAAYVLHSWDWSESSLILDLFTRPLGRVAVVAKGAKRPYSQLRAVLLPFQRLTATLGRSAGDEATEIQTLRGAEWAGGTAVLAGEALFTGFYLNELLMKLLARQDPHPGLFDAYGWTLDQVAAGEARAQPALRAFELVLLREIGLLPELRILTPTQEPVREDVAHALHPEAGLVLAGAGEQGISGRDFTALQSAMDADDLDALQAGCAPVLAALRGQLRGLLHYHLGVPQLRTREVMSELQRLVHASRHRSPSP